MSSSVSTEPLAQELMLSTGDYLSFTAVPGSQSNHTALINFQDYAVVSMRSYFITKVVSLHHISSAVFQQSVSRLKTKLSFVCNALQPSANANFAVRE